MKAMMSRFPMLDEINGVINRLKYLLAIILGHEMEICPRSSLEVVHIANELVLDIGKKKDER